jgi:uncharacterized protein DUF5679
VPRGELLRDLHQLEPDDLQPARFQAAQDGPNQSALDAIGLDDDQGAFLSHMPEGYRTAPLESGACCSPEIEGLFSLDAAPYPSAVVSGRLSKQVESIVATGYCMKCKAQREIKNAKQITMKNGRPATEGACPVCGTKIFKIGAGAK